MAISDAVLSPALSTLGRRDRNKLRTRLALEEAALHLFAERGYEGTTVEDIAERADVSVRTLFRYFPSKENIIYAVPIENLEKLHEAIVHQPAAKSPVAAIRAAHAEVAPGWFRDPHRTFLRLGVIRSTPILSGKVEVRKMWEDAISRALAKRDGCRRPKTEHRLLGALSMTAIDLAMNRWLDTTADAPVLAWQDENLALRKGPVE